MRDSWLEGQMAMDVLMLFQVLIWLIVRSVVIYACSSRFCYGSSLALLLYVILFSMDLEDPPRLLEGRRCPTAPPVEEHRDHNCMHEPGTSGIARLLGCS